MKNVSVDQLLLSQRLKYLREQEKRSAASLNSGEKAALKTPVEMKQNGFFLLFAFFKCDLGFLAKIRTLCHCLFN